MVDVSAFYLTDPERFARRFYRAKVKVYRETLLGLANRHRPKHGRRKVNLSAEIKAALKAEADDHAAKVVRTYNKLIADFAERHRHLPDEVLFRKLVVYAKDRAASRAKLIARVEESTARLDAQVSFFRENGIEPLFDFAGPKPECKVCKRVQKRSPYKIEDVLRIGYPHLNCRHRWAARSVAGELPDTLSLGRGGVAGIVGGEAWLGQHGNDQAAAAAAV